MNCGRCSDDVRYVLRGDGADEHERLVQIDAPHEAAAAGMPEVLRDAIELVAHGVARPQRKE